MKEQNQNFEQESSIHEEYKPIPHEEIVKSKKNWSLIISVIVLFLLFIGGIFWSLGNLKTENKAEDEIKKSKEIGPDYVTDQYLEENNAIVESNNKFALDLYNRYKEKDENIFFSPYSISSAIAMTYEGAKNETAEEIKTVFHFSEDKEGMRNAYLNLFNDINKENKEYKLSVANALWAEKEYNFLDTYFDTVKKYYSGNVTNLDFINDAEKSRVIINDWVEDKTNSKIKNLIPAGLITPLTRLVLTNAVYFKADWTKSFNEDETRDKDFRIDQDNSIKVPMMSFVGDEAEFKYTEDENTQILELPYSGDDLSMLIFLSKNDDLNQLEENLNINQLIEWRENLEKQRVNIYIPKFKFETKYFMAEDLQAMGMPTAFGDDADFSGMTGNKDLLISKVIHQAFVEVDEKGTEAAAATAVLMEVWGMPSMDVPKIPVFNANHPFVFLIQQNNTGNILFMGRVNNPSKQEEEAGVIIPIDTEQEAIYLATEKSDGVSNFSDNYNKFGEIISYAKFYEDKNYWLVIFYPENTQDLSYEVHISLEGNIIYEGSSMGG